ncbi:MAG TPA: hypothetical protein VE684_20390, partial [Crenalkalicoccus sp.]|nr:hypothetical protein [Crenalkalicoccus sp.]
MEDGSLPEGAAGSAPPSAGALPSPAPRPLLRRLRGWLLGTALVSALGLIGKAAADMAADRVKDALGAAASADTACLLGEWWQAARGPEAPDPARFRVLIARLDRDAEGALTRKVVNAFRGQAGFDWRGSCVSVAAGASRAEQEAAVAAAERLRRRHGADLVLWGEVVDAKEPAISVWFTAENAAPDLKARPWRFEKGLLEPAFQSGFAAALAGVAVSTATPALAQEGRYVADLLRPLLPRLDSLLADLPPGLDGPARGRLRGTAALSFQTYGEQAGDEPPLRRAVALYGAAQQDLPRSEAPLDWAATQNNLGVALLRLGERGDDVALRRAVAAYEAALEEYRRDRVPLHWAMTQNNLGIALQVLGERGDDAALRRAVAAYEAALEEYRRDRVPLDWAMTQ